MHVVALQEKQTWTASWQNKVADAHENATRQTVCPCEEGEGDMAEWRIEKKKLSRRQGEKDYLLGHRYFLLAPQNSSCFVLMIPK